MKTPTALVILDGFGWREEKEYNAVALAQKPTFDALWNHYPHTLLQASGTEVGLPPNTPGNSEVGHMTLGAGRIIEQPVTILNNAISDGSFFHNKILLSHLAQLAKTGHSLHLLGLLSNGNVHSAENHLYAYMKAALNAGVKRIIVQAILDGRDVSPRSATEYLQRLQDFCTKHSSVVIGSIMGRYYAMDRDHNWDRTQKAYHCLTQKSPTAPSSWQHTLASFYTKNITDEFIPPTQCAENSIIQSGDGIIFFNLRPDRAQQLINVFADHNFDHFKRVQVTPAFFLTPVPLDGWKNVPVLFPLSPIPHTLKEVLSHAGKTIFCIAETEKYAHVTYFFSGTYEMKHEHETDVLIPSLKRKEYNRSPQMSAPTITKTILNSLQDNPYDFYLINYANADMVGHSGSLPATIKAVECLDAQLKQLYEHIVERLQGTLYIVADHGNAELKYDEQSHQPSTAHTTNPVPFIYVNHAVKNSSMIMPLAGLADVAPFILHNFKLPIPAAMQRR